MHWHRSIFPRGERRAQKASEKGRSERHKIKIKDKDKVQDSQPIKPSTKVDGLAPSLVRLPSEGPSEGLMEACPPWPIKGSGRP